MLYGLEIAQLNVKDLRRLETVQLKVFRKVLNMKTTFVDRANKNKEVYKKIEEKLEVDDTRLKKKKKIVTFQEAYNKFKGKRIIKVVKGKDVRLKQISFQRDLRDWVYAGRRRGHPKKTWAQSALSFLWEYIAKREPRWNDTEWDEEDEEKTKTLEEWASILV